MYSLTIFLVFCCFAVYEANKTKTTGSVFIVLDSDSDCDQFVSVTDRPVKDETFDEMGIVFEFVVVNYNSIHFQSPLAILNFQIRKTVWKRK